MKPTTQDNDCENYTTWCCPQSPNVMGLNQITNYMDAISNTEIKDSA